MTKPQKFTAFQKYNACFISMIVPLGMSFYLFVDSRGLDVDTASVFRFTRGAFIFISLSAGGLFGLINSNDRRIAELERKLDECNCGRKDESADPVSTVVSG